MELMQVYPLTKDVEKSRLGIQIGAIRVHRYNATHTQPVTIFTQNAPHVP